jgi:large subunit ribosomal protein L3
MVPAILGRKIGMSQIFEADGRRVPVTVVEAGPCVVLQVKKADGKDGYHAVQLGFGDVKPHRTTLPEIGHARKAKSTPKRFVREVRLAEAATENVGDTVTVELFTQAGIKYVDVTGVTKGKGTQGAMKRWGFGGQPASHGTERKHRSPGSISGRATNRGTSGCGKKGRHMAGHMGAARCTVRAHPLVGVDNENNLLLIKGSVPGAKGSFVIVRKAKTRA